jgi:hypothetical protein
MWLQLIAQDDRASHSKRPRVSRESAGKQSNHLLAFPLNRETEDSEKSGARDDSGSNDSSSSGGSDSRNGDNLPLDADTLSEQLSFIHIV